jgi:hypothetical protein
MRGQLRPMRRMIENRFVDGGVRGHGLVGSLCRSDVVACTPATRLCQCGSMLSVGDTPLLLR